MPMTLENKGIDHFIPGISHSKIYEMFVDETSDNFGRSLCNYVLQEAKSFFSTTQLQVSWKQLTRNGGQPLSNLPGLEKIKGYLPSTTALMRDQWGYSNLQEPDGVFFIQIKDAKDRLVQTIPLFVEVDTGDESHKTNQGRRGAMKMWQSTAAGHIDTSQKVKYVATLRFQTQRIDKQLHKAVKDKSSSFTTEDAIMRHNYDLACGVAEIVHGLIIPVYKKNNANIVWGADVMDQNFFRPLYEYGDKATKSNESHLFDYHFFIGQFEFDVFNFGSMRNMPPHPSPVVPNVTYKNEVSEFSTKKSDAEYLSLFGKTKPDMKQYFKDNNGTRVFKTYTDPSWPGYESQPRNLDGFWDKQNTWTCTIEHASKKNRKPMPKQNNLYSETYLQRISVKRVDLREFDLALQKHVELIKTGATEPLALPQNMYYLHEIVGVLDRYITYCNSDEDILKAALNVSFDIKGAKVRVPESSSYETISRQQKEQFLRHFFKYSGYHLFIEPFVNAMENVLFYLGHDMFTNHSADTHISYKNQINDYKESINLNKYQQPDMKTHVKIDKESLNLGSVLLKAYNEKRNLTVKGGHDAGRIPLDPELKEYLKEKFKNDHLEAFCQYVKCYNLHLLLELVHAYMKEENMQKKLEARITAFPIGVQIDIKYMMKFVYNDSTFGMQSRVPQISKPPKHYVDNDLSTGLLKIIVKGFFHLPCTATFNLDRTSILIDGDIIYETGNWKIFVYITGSIDQFNVLKPEFRDFWLEDVNHTNSNWLNALTRSLAISAENSFIQAQILQNNFCQQKYTGAFFFISSIWNVPFDIAISSTSQDNLKENIKIHNEKLRTEFPEIKAECLQPFQLNNRFETVKVKFEKIRKSLIESFPPFFYFPCASDSNYIILYMQLFFRCAFNDFAFEHCWEVLNRYVQAERSRDGALREEQIYRKFDLFDDAAPERYCNDTGLGDLQYVLPFYELYKAMYVAKLYTYWYLRYVHEAASDQNVMTQLSWSLNQRHQCFRDNFSRQIWNRMPLIEGGARTQFDGICNKFLVDSLKQYDKNDTEWNDHQAPTSNLSNFLVHNLSAATNQLKQIYLNIRRHGLFVSREYISIAELNSYLETLLPPDRQKSVDNVNFEKAWDDVTAYFERYNDAGTEENQYHLPNSKIIVYDPTMQRVKTHFSIDAMDIQLTDFKMLQRELYVWSCSKKLKIFKNILHTTVKYDKVGPHIESIEDKVDCTEGGNPNNIRTIREIDTYEDVQQNEQTQKIIRLHAGKTYSPNTNAETLEKQKMKNFDSFKMKSVSDRSTTLLLHQILNTFFLIHTPNAKPAKMRLFLYRKFSCLRDRYLPYQLKSTLKKNKESPLCDDYFKDLLINIRNYEKNQNEEVLSFSNDSDYLEEVKEEKEFLLTRTDAATSNYANHKILQIDVAEPGKKNRNWFDKRVKDDKKTEIETNFFDDSVIIARAINLAWSWKWMAVRQSRVREFASFFPVL
tara:strand:- start:4496 stop:8914 length:4419 start_codon:yes stop_codon:yes gene_type:complete